MSAFFVTGTDTGVGKTLMSCALLAAARASGLSCAGFKPVAAGVDASARNDDALHLQACSSLTLAYDTVNPLLLAAPLSPHIAAARERRTIDLVDLCRAVNEGIELAGADFNLVEGAGGWLVPVNGAQTMADLAQALNLPVILVVGLRLGCLNHALLSAQAIAASGLHFAGWIANRVDPDMEAVDENIATLVDRLEAPLLGQVDYHKLPRAEALARHFDISILLKSAQI